MKFKRIIFWAHLVSGVASGLIVLFLSVTGVLLTYELQIIEALEKPALVVNDGDQRLSADDLVSRAQEMSQGKVSGLVFDKHENVPIALQAGRGQHSLINPYTGDMIENASGARSFFSTVTQLHRWFALEGTSKDVGEAIIAAANLVFLFLLVSGVYLWLPKAWRWPIVKTKMFFRGNLPTTQARDYNWHHVMSFWTFIPLFFIIITGVVFSYKWANNMVYAVYGEEAPKRGGPPQSGGAAQYANAQFDPANALSLEALLSRAQEYDTGVQRVTLELPKEDAPVVNFKLDSGTGKQPQKAINLSLDRSTGDVLNTSGFGDRTPAQQTRVVIRFLHTGEVLGIVGQTIAGISSLAACFLVYTGLALAYRRLIVPVIRKRKAAALAAQ